MYENYTNMAITSDKQIASVANDHAKIMDYWVLTLSTWSFQVWICWVSQWKQFLEKLIKWECAERGRVLFYWSSLKIWECSFYNGSTHLHFTSIQSKTVLTESCYNQRYKMTKIASLFNRITFMHTCTWMLLVYIGLEKLRDFAIIEAN